MRSVDIFLIGSPYIVALWICELILWVSELIRWVSEFILWVSECIPLHFECLTSSEGIQVVYASDEQGKGSGYRPPVKKSKRLFSSYAETC